MTGSGTQDDPSTELDDALSSPRRLLICAVLQKRSDLDFGELGEATGLSKSSLSKHLAMLTRSGHVTLERISTPGRRRTRVALTNMGLAALSAHASALREILGDFL